MLKSKQVLFLSDFHCGSEVGLTPKHWNDKPIPNDVSKHNKLVKIRRECWTWFKENIKDYINPDILVIDGDLIDGQNIKQFGVGQLTTNLLKQAQMAVDIINIIDARKVVITYGSNYHVSSAGQEWEDVIATKVNASIGIHQHIKVNGLVFDIKHHCGRSSVPYGKYTPLAKQITQAMLWKEYKQFPGADVYIRGHAHKYKYLEDSMFVAISLPSLKGLGEPMSKYWMDVVDFGFVVCDVTSKGNYNFTKHLGITETQIPKIKEF